MAEARAPWEGLLDPALAADLAAPEESGTLPLTDLRLVRDLCEVSGRREPEAQALVLALLVAREEGSLCVRLTPADLARRLGRLLTEGGARRWAPRVVSAFPPGAPADWLVGPPERGARPLVQVDGGPAPLVYFQAYHHAKVLLEERFRGLLASSDAPLAEASAIDRVLCEVLEEHPQRAASGAPMEPSEEQRAGVRLGLTRKLAVISGGPGTGKTTLVCALLRCLTRLGVAADDVRLAAPSGRAAQRMTESLQAALASVEGLTEAERALLDLEGSTIHRLLGHDPTRLTPRHHADDPLPARVVVLDEVSMVDAELMSDLLDALLPDARLILLGDRNQLPSIGCGAVLADLLPERSSRSEHAVVLSTNHRSEPEIRSLGALLARAASGSEVLEWLSERRTTAAELADRLADDPEGCLWLEPAHPGEWRRARDAWLHAWLPEEHFAQARRGGAPEGLLCTVERSRILTLVRRGEHGCEGVNAHAERLLAGASSGGCGLPLIVTRNDSRTGLWNGDVGVFARLAGGGVVAHFRRGGEVRAIAPRELPEWEGACAMTVHKSQGSEYASVLTVVPPEGAERLLSREMVYTAITRARRLVVLCAERGALLRALAHRVERTTGIELPL